MIYHYILLCVFITYAHSLCYTAHEGLYLICRDSSSEEINNLNSALTHQVKYANIISLACTNRVDLENLNIQAFKNLKVLNLSNLYFIDCYNLITISEQLNLDSIKFRNCYKSTFLQSLKKK
jgi:hypothetical protein